MRAWVGELVIEGRDFDVSRGVAAKIAEERDYHFVPSFHPEIVKGAATYALELFEAIADIDVVYVPIGMGVRHLRFNHDQRPLGAENRDRRCRLRKGAGLALSFEAGEPVGTETALTFADA